MSLLPLPAPGSTAYQWMLTLIGGVFGAIVSAVFAAVSKVIDALRARTPVRRMLGSLTDSGVIAGLYVRTMFSRDGKYESYEPEFSRTTATAPLATRHWTNIGYVVAHSDMMAAADVEAAIAEAGRRTPLSTRDLRRDWENWSEPVAVVGGNYKSEWVLSNALPHLVALSANLDAFLVTGQPPFSITAERDLGLIYRGVHPSTRDPCLVVMGIGTLGTEAAGYFFRKYASLMGRRFSRTAFAVIIEARVVDGREGGRVAWFTSEKRVLAPIASRKWERLCVSSQPTGPVLQGVDDK